MKSHYEATVEHSFAASHSVKLADGSYEPMHLHNWRVTATFRSRQLDDAGFVVDFVAAQDALHRATADLVGGDLNAVAELACGPSAERVAELVARRVVESISARLYKVAVTEAPGCAAAYYPEET